MLYYEEILVFEKLYAEEKHRKYRASQVIVEWFRYSTIISNPVLSLYLRNIYPVEIFENSNAIVESAFNDVNKIVESFGYNYSR